ncbi:MAG TPA: hypothetical protein VF627_04180 [Abditibacterium sp.]|jgi:hypothetical protein
MTNYEQRNRDRLLRSATWVFDRPTIFAATSPAHEVAGELQEVVTRIDAAAQGQSATGRDASGAVVSTEALLAECEADIRRAAKTARGLERKNPGIAAQFALPSKWTWQDIANNSIAFCDNATQYAAAFGRMGLDAAWWADLRADATEISVRKSGQQSEVDARIGHTAALGDLVREGVDILAELEPMVENALHLAHQDAELASFERAARLDHSTKRGPNQMAKT